MDQDSTNSGERRNWRERLGIAKDNSKELPKISEEFRSESGGQPGEPRLVVGQSSAPSVKAAASDTPTAPVPAPRGQGATPVRPAPMAPRPTATTGAGQPPQNQHAANPVSPQTPRAAPSGQAKPPAVPSARAAAPQASARAASAAASAAAANGSGGPASDDFAERLRQQREAAERLARQRAATARVQNGAPPPLAKVPETAPTPPRFSFAPDELAGDAKPAPAPAAAAPKAPQRPPAQNGGQQGWQPPFQAAPGPSPYAPPRSPGYPYGQQPYQPQRMAAPAYARPPQQGQAAAQQQAQAPYAAVAYGQEAWNGAETARSAPARAPVPQRAESYAGQPELAYGNAAEDVYADQARARRPVPVPVAPRTPAVRPRVSGPEEQEQDDLYETDRRSDRSSGGRQQRAQVADYNNAYREYDEDYVEEEPRSRSGPLILLLALLALAVIVGVLIFFYTQNFNLPSSSSAANHDIPVIAPSEGPAKATPEPQVDTATAAPGPAPASSAPQPMQGRKQIYDRILGEEAVEQNKLVPTEEQPVAPPRSGNGQDSGQTTTGGGGAPLPEPGSDSGTPAQSHGHDSTAPEPLPLPPPPGVQGSNEPPAPADGAEAMTSPPEPQPDASARGDDTLIEPTSEQSEGNPEPDLVKPVASRPQPESAKTAADDAPAAAKGTNSETGTSSQGSVGAVAQGAAPSGTAKTKTPRAAKAGTPVPPAQNEAAESETIVDTLPPPPGAVAGQPASLGAPARLGQSGQPVSPAGSAYSGQAAAPQGGNQPAYFDQFQRQAQQAANAGQRPQRTGRDVDPLDGLRTPLSGRSSVPAPPPQQLAMAEPPAGALPPAAPPPASFTGQQVSAPPPAQAVHAPAPAARVQQPSPARITPPPAPAARPQQQAALIPATAPAVTGGTGYVVQLASFRSEAEAAGEFRRLQSRHPQLVGALQQRIQRADLGASGTFYRLGVGPLGSKDQASRLCNSLIAAGEKDCLVRRQ
jgi:SPOR domain